jgi:hypothetical protein
VRSRTAADAYAIASSVAAGDKSFAVHCWTFIPESFRALGTELAEAGLMPLNLVEGTQTHGHEFFVRLQRDDAAGQAQCVRSWSGELVLDEDGLPEDFNAEGYRRRNSDVEAAGVDAAIHWQLSVRAHRRARLSL